MPAGTPRIDEERKERHQATYGNDNIPKVRKGLGASRASANKLIEVILVIGILYFLSIILQRGSIL